jgi:hypothetical protein
VNNYKKLKVRWETLLAEGRAGYCFDPELLASGKFCVHVTDFGVGMSCGSCVETTGFFTDVLDAFGYLRFCAIPRILDINLGGNKEQLNIADSYLLNYEPEERERVDHLLGLLDRALISVVVSAPDLSLIRDEFNRAFENTNPSLQIHAWGSVSETLNSGYFGEADEGEELQPELKRLFDTGKFDDGNPKHLVMARKYFTSRFRA